MEAREKEPWVNYLEGDCLLGEAGVGGRVYQVVIRVKPEALQVIVKVRDGDKYLVWFGGAGTLPSLARKVREALAGDGVGWKEDRYPPT